MMDIETLFFDYWRQHQLPIKVARIFNTYVRAPIRTMDVWYRASVQALRNQDITLFGDGEQTRSFCYVDGLIRNCPAKGWAGQNNSLLRGAPVTPGRRRGGAAVRGDTPEVMP
jgi:hypothetical protein